jgi:hypothetical protein
VGFSCAALNRIFRVAQNGARYTTPPIAASLFLSTEKSANNPVWEEIFESILSSLKVHLFGHVFNK